MGWGGKSTADDGWTAVDAGENGVYGVTVKRSSGGNPKPQVLKAVHLPGPLLDADTLSQVAKRIGVSRFPWTLPLNRQDYTIMVVPEPQVQATEMAQSLRWSLATMLDFPIDQAAVDWMPIPTRKHLPQRAPHLYAVVAKAAIVDERTEAFRKAKIPLAAVDIRETAQRNIAALIEKPGEGLGMVSINSQGVEITFTFDGELYLDRHMDESLEALVAGDDFTRERIFERIALQLQRSSDFINRTLPFMRVGRIVLAPLPPLVPLRDFLSGKLAEPVESLSLGSIFDFSLTPELEDEYDQIHYFSVLGAALRNEAGLS